MLNAINRRQARCLLEHDALKKAVTSSGINVNLLTFRKVSSTNDLAKRLSNSTLEKPTLVISEEQTGGRGRYNRKWISPPFVGLWFSLVYQINSNRNIGLLPIAVGVVIAASIEENLQLFPSLKWPNDVLVNGKKVSGILCESVCAENLNKTLIIGVGVNLNQEDFTGYPENATSLYLQSGKFTDRTIFLVSTINRLLCTLNRLHQPEFLDSIRADWLSRAFRLNEEIELQLSNKSIVRGRFKGLTERGEIILEDRSNRVHFFDNGEVKNTHF